MRLRCYNAHRKALRVPSHLDVRLGCQSSREWVEQTGGCIREEIRQPQPGAGGGDESSGAAGAFESEGDAPAREVVGGELDAHAIPQQDPDIMPTHLA